MSVSIIISARNEFPQLPMTITNLMLDMDQSGIKDYEFIIADNGSTDETTRFFTHAYNNPYAKKADFQMAKEYRFAGRGLLSEGRLRFCHDPIFSNVGARHNAVQYARYNQIIFADGHIAVKAGTIKNVLETQKRYGGTVHAPVAWMGAWSGKPRAGMQYSYKIGEKIWGTWNYAQVSENPFYIPLSGHCFIAVNKEEYMKMGGYDTHQQIYGGGENYLDTLYWMMGSNVMTDPRGMVYHLSAGRGYSYNIAALIHNMMLTSYTLGGEKWSERILVTYFNKSGTDKGYLKEIYAQALADGKEKREFIEANQKMTLDQVLGLNMPHDCDGGCRGEKYRGVSDHTKRIWDLKNEELHGKHLSFVQVFDDWLDRLTDPEAIDFFKNSPHQHPQS